jgi:hypothetical protein
MGSGKSLFGVRQGVGVITQAKYWITNQRLYDDAFEKIARHYCRTGTDRKIQKLANVYRAHYIFTEDMQEARRFRVPGRDEARALFTWDEAHNDLNNRTYKEREQAQLEWATQLRKLGFVGFLLSQHHMNTDAQLRRISNGVVMLINQREQHRVLGMRITPWPLFLAYWYPTHVGGSGKVMPWRVDRYLLSWHRKLYDTMDLYHGVSDLEESGDTIMLPTGGWRDRAEARPQPTAERDPLSFWLPSIVRGETA